MLWAEDEALYAETLSQGEKNEQESILPKAKSAAVSAQKPGPLEISPVFMGSGDTEMQKDQLLALSWVLDMDPLHGKKVAEEGAPGWEGSMSEWLEAFGPTYYISRHVFNQYSGLIWKCIGTHFYF